MCKLNKTDCYRLMLMLKTIEVLHRTVFNTVRYASEALTTMTLKLPTNLKRQCFTNYMAWCCRPAWICPVSRPKLICTMVQCLVSSQPDIYPPRYLRAPHIKTFLFSPGKEERASLQWQAIKGRF